MLRRGLFRRFRGLFCLGCRFGLGLPLQRGLRNVRLRGPIDDAVLRLQCGGGGIDFGKNVGGRRLAAVGQGAGILDQPAVAVMDPDVLAETAVGIEDPGADAVGPRDPNR